MADFDKTTESVRGKYRQFSRTDLAVDPLAAQSPESADDEDGIGDAACL